VESVQKFLDSEAKILICTHATFRFAFDTAKLEQTRHKKGRRAKPRSGFYILICGGFENKLL
jgi:hypothetical protein